MLIAPTVARTMIATWIDTQHFKQLIDSRMKEMVSTCCVSHKLFQSILVVFTTRKATLQISGPTAHVDHKLKASCY